MRVFGSPSRLIRSGKRFMSTRSSIEDIISLRNFSTVVPNIEKELDLYSKKKQTSVSLKTLMESGRGEIPNLPFGSTRTNKASEKVVMQVACFLHRELPVRLAHRAAKLEASPIFNKSGEW